MLENSLIDLRYLESVYADLDNKEYRQVDPFNVYDIYTMYKRVPVHWTSVRPA
jgi:hypothetical protein